MANSTYKDPNGQAPGQSAEKVNSQTGAAGLYRHPDSGQELITLSDPLYGDAQSEGAIRVGFVRVGDAPKGSIKSFGIPSEVFENRPTAGSEDTLNAIKGLQARTNALEAENARLREAQSKGTTVDKNHGVPGGEEAKADGEEAVKVQASNSYQAPAQNLTSGTGSTDFSKDNVKKDDAKAAKATSVEGKK